MPATFLAPSISDLFLGRAIRVAPVSYDYPRIAIPFHGFSHEFHCGGLIARLRNEGLQNFALMVDGTPKVVRLSTDLHEEFVQTSLSLRRLYLCFRPALTNLVREASAKAVDPMSDRFLANINAALMEQIFYIAK